MLSVAAGADAQAQAPGLLGKWSADQSCGAQARQIVFRPNTMELWDQNQRLFSGNVRFRNTGNQTNVTVVSIGRGASQRPGNPEVGDIATFRRDGNRLHGIAVTRNGERRAAPGGTPPFFLCP